MRYLLDTNILIDLSGPRYSDIFFKEILRQSNSQFFVHIVSIAEYMSGAGKTEEIFLRGWIESGELHVIFWDDYEDAIRVGSLRRETKLSLPDVMIISACQNQEVTLLTHDQELMKRAKAFISVRDPMNG